MRRPAALLLLPLAFIVSIALVRCGGEEAPQGPSVRGIVVAVDGDLTAVDSFTVVDESGESFTFLPAEGLTFHGGPLSHLTAHLTSGDAIRVVYEDRDGALVAVFVDDA